MALAYCTCSYTLTLTILVEYREPERTGHVWWAKQALKTGTSKPAPGRSMSNGKQTRAGAPPTRLHHFHSREGKAEPDL
eukprot:213022-Chlamydomonas_euryale.AAC.11